MLLSAEEAAKDPVFQAALESLRENAGKDSYRPTQKKSPMLSPEEAAKDRVAQAALKSLRENAGK